MSTRGFVRRPELLRQVRSMIRDDAYRMGVWPKISRALDAVRPGPRGDLVMVEQDRQGVLALTLVGYAETLGAVPRVEIGPVADLEFRTRDSTLQEPNVGSATIEIVSRLAELRAAAAASGSPRIEVEIKQGDGVLAARLTLAIEAIPHEGIPIVLDGRSDDLRPVPGAARLPAYRPDVVGLFRTAGDWLDYETGNSPAAVRELIAETARTMWIADDEAWWTAMPGHHALLTGDLSVSPSPAGAGAAVRGFLRRPSAESFDAFYRRAEISGVAAKGTRQVVDNIGRGNGVSGALILDEAGAEVGLMFMQRDLVLDRSRPGVVVAGYLIAPKIIPIRNDRTTEFQARHLSAPAVAAQVEADLRALAASSPFGNRTVVDVALFQHLGRDMPMEDVGYRVAAAAARMAGESVIAVRSCMGTDTGPEGSRSGVFFSASAETKAKMLTPGWGLPPDADQDLPQRRP